MPVGLWTECLIWTQSGIRFVSMVLLSIQLHVVHIKECDIENVRI